MIDDDSGSEGAQGRWLRRGLGVLIAVILVAAPLAIGTVHPWTRTVVFSLCALLMLGTLVERLRARRRIAVTVPAVALGAAAVFSALQLIPLPPSIVAALSPTAHEIFNVVDESWAHALSLDPSATARELAKICAYLAFFFAVATHASRSQRRRFIVYTVAGTAVLIAVIGLVQAAVGARRILFFYTPQAEWLTLVRGTFVNPNHFGALLCLGAPCTLAIALREPRLRIPAIAGTFLINVAVVLSLARASVAALLIGQALTFAFDRLQLQRGSEWLRSRPATMGLLVVAIVAALGVATLAGRSQLSTVLAQTSHLGEEIQSPISKVHVWQRSAELLWSFPWTGVGRGAFEPAFNRISEVGGVVRYQWMENGYLETLVDFGVPAASLLFLLAGWGLLLAARRLRDDPLAVGVLSAVLALAIHDAADFSVELPGVGLPALALLATLFGRRSAQPEQGRRRAVVRWPYLLVPFILLAPTVMALRMPSAEDDARMLAAAAHDPELSTEGFQALATAARRRHPADYYICLLAAERLAHARSPETLRWLNDAMLLNPTHPTPHVMAAEVLAASGRKAQALVEYRLAAAGAAEPRREVWPYVLARYPALDDLLAATPDETRNLGTLVKWLTSIGRLRDAETVWDRIVAREPRNARALSELVRLAIERKDAAAAAQRLPALLAVDDGPTSQRLRARERLLAGDPDAAGRLLDRLGDHTEAALGVELEVALALSAAGRTDEGRARLDQVGRWLLSRAARVRLHEARAEIERQAGNEHQYRWEIEQRDLLLRP